MKSWRILVAILLSLVLVGSTACNPFSGTKPEATQQLVKVVKGDLTVAVSGSGNIEVSNETKLAFGTGGRVERIYVEEGDKVNKGDVLAKLETDTLGLALTQANVTEAQSQLALVQAQTAVDQAQVTVSQAQVAVGQAQVARDQADSNLNQLRRRGAVPFPSDYDEQMNIARSQLEVAELQLATSELQLVVTESQSEAVGLQFKIAESQLELSKQNLALAQKQLDKATITAPFAGTIASVDVDERDTILAATTIIHLIDLSSMKLNVEVDEIDINEVKPEQRATIEIDALPNLALGGKVSSISLLPTQAAGVVVYDVKIEFDIPDGISLRVGMSATADIIIAQRSNVLLVPDRAIKQDSQGNTIVEVMVNGQLEERKVIIGISDGIQTEVVDGLGEGELVVDTQTTPKTLGPGLFGQ